jgi:hypothetical protein
MRSWLILAVPLAAAGMIGGACSSGAGGGTGAMPCPDSGVCPNGMSCVGGFCKAPTTGANPCPAYCEKAITAGCGELQQCTESCDSSRASGICLAEADAVLACKTSSGQAVCRDGIPWIDSGGACKSLDEALLACATSGSGGSGGGFGGSGGGFGGSGGGFGGSGGGFGGSGGGFGGSGGGFGGSGGGFGGSGGGFGGSGGGLGGSGGGSGGCPVAPADCESCQTAQNAGCYCAARATACENDNACRSILDCVFQGTGGVGPCLQLDAEGAACVVRCGDLYPAGKQAYLAWETCVYCQYCRQACDATDYCSILSGG